jgi:electron transfer flavoprotein alpha subunit
MSTLVVLEQYAGGWHPASLEAIVAAQALGQPASAVVAGHNVGDLAADAATRKLDRVYSIDHPLLADYTPDAYTTAIADLIKATNPDIVLFPHTYRARDFASKLAARFVRPLVSDVIGFKTGDGAPLFVRQLFQGKLLADVRVAGAGPHFATVQSGAFRVDDIQSGAAEVEQLTPELDAVAIRTKPGEAFRESEGAVDLAASERIVAAGRGVQDEDDLELIKKLADALGAEVAASRPICDNGWLPMERQVGSSGQTVAPKLYIAIGISGAIQHLVGMKGSHTIVAINKDPDAPIFEVADYGIAGDLYEVVPALIEALN